VTRVSTKKGSGVVSKWSHSCRPQAGPQIGSQDERQATPPKKNPDPFFRFPKIVRRSSASLLPLLLTLAPSIAFAQTPPPSRPPEPTLSAVIRGRVIAADTGRPLRRVRIAVSAPSLVAGPRTINTSADGRYEIKDLPAGRYTVSAGRSGYLSLRYGQSRPLEQGRPLVVLDGQIVANIDFALPRMSVIAGRITDEVGQPLSGVRVFFLRPAYVDGQRRLASAESVVTDDAGQYRAVSLAPSAYYVFATLRQTWTIIDGGVEQVVGYTPTYFPGTPAAADARRVTLRVGEQVNNADFSMIRGRGATVSGRAFDSHGRPLDGETVYLGLETPGTGQKFNESSGPIVGGDGTFAIKNLAPGDYKLIMRYQAGEGATLHLQESASMRIAVNGVDLRDVQLVTSAGGLIAGQVTTESGTIPRLRRERIKILGEAVSRDADLRVGGIDDSGEVKDDWTFYVGGLFGRTRIRATLPDGWALKAVMRDGHDITDTPIELKSGERLSGIQVVVTDRVTSVIGQVNDARGAPVSDGTLIVFAADAERWQDPSRFIRAARPDQLGHVQVRGLAPGEYLAAAIGYVEEGMWIDPEYLESIRRVAQKITLGEGETRTIALTLVTP
jgi:Carboxypeptidase regulatory-like domain